MSNWGTEKSIYCNGCGTNVTSTLREEHDNNYYCLDCAQKIGIEIKSTRNLEDSSIESNLGFALRLFGAVIIVSSLWLGFSGSPSVFILGTLIGIHFIVLAQIIILLTKILNK